MPGLKFIDAAQHIRATYANANGHQVVDSFNKNGVQARILKGGLLVIPGTNEKNDWWRFNFNVLRGHSGSLWHDGFYKHAMAVYTWAKPRKPRYIVGHSLGAASAQIVGMSLAVPTIAFASPRPLKGRLVSSHGKWVININRRDDGICGLPPLAAGFRHVGRAEWIGPLSINLGEDHRMDKYIALLKQDRVKRQLPPHWPM